METLPSDPFMLYSFVNMKLRDAYSSLDALCSDLGIDCSDLERRLHGAGFDYMPEANQFR